MSSTQQQDADRVATNISFDTPNNHRLGIAESIRTQPKLYIMWVVAIIICMAAYKYAVGFKTAFTKILGLVLFLILLTNMFLSGIDNVDTYDQEISLYSYVESDARAFLPFGIALAALIIATGTKQMLQSKDFLKALLLSTCCFVLVLTIVWMPKDSGLPIRMLRDFKTAILTLGGITVVALVGNYVFRYSKSGQ